MAHDVFISHSHEDKVLADAVCAALEAATIRCWIAPRDVLAGRDWAESIVEAISDARVMVLIYSGHTAASTQVKRELTLAVESDTIIVPLRIENVPLSGLMQFYLSEIHWLDAMNPPSQHEIATLVQTVQALLAGPGRKPDSTQPLHGPSIPPPPAPPGDGGGQHPGLTPQPQPQSQPYAPQPQSQPYAPQQPQPQQPRYAPVQAPAAQASPPKRRIGTFVGVGVALVVFGILLTVAGFFIFITFFYNAPAEAPPNPQEAGGLITLSWANEDDLDILIYSAESGDYLGACWEIGGYDSVDGTKEDEYLALDRIAAEYRAAGGYYVVVLNNSSERTDWVDFILTVESEAGTAERIEGRVTGISPQDEWIACWVDGETGELLERIGLYADGTEEGSGEPADSVDEFF